MIKVYLHIGFEKTGTTSLQEFLRLNRPHLLKQKVLYPVSPGESNHHQLVAYSVDHPAKINDLIIVNRLSNLWDNEENRKAFTQKLNKEVYHSDTIPDTVIFSNEHCSSRLTTTGEISRIQDLMNEVFRRADLKIVMYVRRQDDFILSNYTTLVMNGYTGSFEDYFQSSVNDYIIQYLRIIKNWENVFGRENLIVRAYPHGKDPKNTTIEDFLHVAKINADDSFVYPKKLNTSLDALCLEFLRNFNARIPYIKEEKHNSKERGNIVELLTNLSGSQKLRLSSGQLSILKKKFSEQNRQIVSEYAVERGHIISFKETEAAMEEGTHLETQEGMETHFDLFARLWVEKQKRINLLYKELAHLNNRLEEIEIRGKKGFHKLIEKWQKLFIRP